MKKTDQVVNNNYYLQYFEAIYLKCNRDTLAISGLSHVGFHSLTVTVLSHLHRWFL